MSKYNLAHIRDIRFKKEKKFLNENSPFMNSDMKLNK